MAKIYLTYNQLTLFTSNERWQASWCTTLTEKSLGFSRLALDLLMQVAEKALWEARASSQKFL